MVFSDLDKIISNEMNLEKWLVVFFAIAFVFVIYLYIKGLDKISDRFNLMKYSNFYVGAFKFLKEKEKELVYKYVIESIIINDLELKKIIKHFKNSQKYQRILLEELNSISFKKFMVSEFDYNRFINEVSIRRKRPGWIRDYLNFKDPYQRAVFITLKNTSVSAVLNNIDGIKQALLVNLNLGEKKIELNTDGLRKDILKVNKSVETINLEHRIILNPRISQHQFARVLNCYTEENLKDFKAKRFAAFFSGFEGPDSKGYNCQNLFTPYVMDLTDDETKEFIALLRFLMEKKVLLGKEVNAYTKLGLIIELFVENCLMDSQTIRKNFSSKFKHIVSLDKETIRKINSYIHKELPAL